MFLPVSRAQSRAVLAGVIALVALLPGVVSACPAKPAFATTYSAAPLKSSLPAMRSSAGVQGAVARLVRRSGMRFYPAARPHASGAVSSAQSLAIAQGDLPQGATIAVNQPMDAPSLDADTGPLVTAFHTKTGTYAASGFGGSWYQAGTVTLDSAGDNAVFEWLGSYYGTADQATARVTDAVAYFKANNITPTPCSQTSTGCDLFVVDVTINNVATTLAFAIFSQGNAVGEVLVAAPSDVAKANQNNFVALIANVLSGGGKAVTSALQGGTPGTPGPTATPTITIKDLELDHQVSGKLKITKSLKPKEKGVFLVVVSINDLGTNTPAASITVAKGTKLVGTGDMNNLGTDTAGEIGFGFVHGFNPGKTTKFSATVTVSAGTATAKKTLSFKVKKP